MIEDIFESDSIKNTNEVIVPIYLVFCAKDRDEIINDIKTYIDDCKFLPDTDKASFINIFIEQIEEQFKYDCELETMEYSHYYNKCKSIVFINSIRFNNSIFFGYAFSYQK